MARMTCRLQKINKWERKHISNSLLFYHELSHKTRTLTCQFELFQMIKFDDDCALNLLFYCICCSAFTYKETAYVEFIVSWEWQQLLKFFLVEHKMSGMEFLNISPKLPLHVIQRKFIVLHFRIDIWRSFWEIRNFLSLF